MTILKEREIFEEFKFNHPKRCEDEDVQICKSNDFYIKKPSFGITIQHQS